MTHILGIILPVLLMAVPALSQPKLIVPEPGSYLPGDRIDSAIYLYDSEARQVLLEELFSPGYKAVVLCLLGGAADGPPDSSRRGNLWCEDSFDDLAVQRALVSWFEGRDVRFIAVAIPDVLTPGPLGRENLFLAASDNKAFSEKFIRFIADTEKERVSSLLPFAEVYYDPRGRLILGSSALGDSAPGYGEIFEWQGKFKWHLDPRTYGLPSIWILKGDGTVACEPFWGNDYDASPPQISYGFEELKAAVEKLLE